MKSYERRAADAYPYYVLSKRDETFAVFVRLKGAYPSRDAAVKVARRSPGVYRLCQVTERGRIDEAPFTV